MCSGRLRVFLVDWKIFSQTKFFPMGSQGLQMLPPTGSAWSSLHCGSLGTSDLVPAPSWRGARNHMAFGLKGQAEECLSHAVLTCESKQWANVSSPRSNCNPLDMPKNRRKGKSLGQANLGYWCLAVFQDQWDTMQGRMVGNLGRKLLGCLVKFR